MMYKTATKVMLDQRFPVTHIHLDGYAYQMLRQTRLIVPGTWLSALFHSVRIVDDPGMENQQL